ncbi:MAG: SRPBCC family protein [Candidatus Nanopelagicales bacterium]
MSPEQKVRALSVTAPDERSIVVTREFAAPPDRLWRAHTEPELLKKWLGRRAYPMTTCEVDLRVGGRYRYVFTKLDGSKPMGMGGVFDVIERPTRLVTTEAFDDFPGPSVNTIRFEEIDGGTAMTLTVVYPSEEIRDGWLASGMTDGMGEGYDRLDGLLLDD